MPDFYQGTEFWDFSMVDPDNRRPVDYDMRRASLHEITDWADRQRTWRDGRIKQAMIQEILQLRRRVPDLFARGNYTPLEVSGPLENHVVAFARTRGESILIVVVPRLVYRLLQGNDAIALDTQRLRDSVVSIPVSLHGRQVTSLFNPAEVVTLEPALPIWLLIENCPMAVLYAV